jgi:hypothetical protein
MKRVFLSSLVLLSLGFTTGARAGKPITGTVIESDHLYPWESQRVNATEWTESGYATQAFNWLQDSLGKPRIDEVWYDFDSDLFHWRGPATGNRMAMSREKFEEEILFPYFTWYNAHHPVQISSP